MACVTFHWKLWKLASVPLSLVNFANLSTLTSMFIFFYQVPPYDHVNNDCSLSGIMWCIEEYLHNRLKISVSLLSLVELFKACFFSDYTQHHQWLWLGVVRNVLWCHGGLELSKWRLQKHFFQRVLSYSLEHFDVDRSYSLTYVINS